MAQVPNAKSILNAYLDIAQSISAAFRNPNVLAILSVLGVIVTFSSLVYMLLEGWSFLNAVYFCVVTMSTVGYGDFSPHTALGKLFTIVYLLIGIGVFVLAVSAIAEAIFTEYKKRVAKE